MKKQLALIILLIAAFLVACGGLSDKPKETTVENPTVSPAGGSFATPTSVNMICPTANASIRYTTDGSRPSTNYGIIYTSPITISNTMILNAIAYKDGLMASSVVSNLFTIEGTLANPTFSPSGGTYNNDQTVNISCLTPDVTIQWSTNNGIDWITSSSANILRTSTLHAKAVKTGYTDSSIVDAPYTMKAATPKFSIPAGTYDCTQNVAISSTTSGVTIHWSTNNWSTSETGTSTSIDQSVTLQTRATKAGYTDSDTASTAYTIDNSIFAIFSDTISLDIAWDVDTKIDIWPDFGAGANIISVTNEVGEGSISMEITGTGTWMGFSIIVDPLTNYRNLSIYNYLNFMYKGTNRFKVGFKSIPSADLWYDYSMLSNFGLKLDGTWCNVKIPFTNESGFNKTNIQEYFWFVSDPPLGYSSGNVHYIDHLYFSVY